MIRKTSRNARRIDRAYDGIEFRQKIEEYGAEPIALIINSRFNGNIDD